MFYLVVYFVVLSSYAVACPSDSASMALFLLQPSVEDIQLLSSSYKLWRFVTAADRMVELATNMTTGDLGLLFLVDNHIPPTSFLDAIEAMTVTQRTRTVQLSLQGNDYEIERILDGIIFTLSKEDQLYTRNFLHFLTATRCLDDALSRASVKISQNGLRPRRLKS